MKTSSSLTCSVLVFLFAAGPARAGILYDNGPVNGTQQAWNISSWFVIANSFTVSRDASASSVTFGSWRYPGDTLTSVDWAINTDPDPNLFPLYGGTAAVTSTYLSTYVNGAYQYDIYKSSFSLPDVPLQAGITYWLDLTNAQASGGSSGFWDENSGSSLAHQYTYNNAGTSLVLVRSPNSESFQILDASVPEPSSGVLLFLGAGIWLAMRRRIPSAFRR